MAKISHKRKVRSLQGSTSHGKGRKKPVINPLSHPAHSVNREEPSVYRPVIEPVSTRSTLLPGEWRDRRGRIHSREDQEKLDSSSLRRGHRIHNRFTVPQGGYQLIPYFHGATDVAIRGAYSVPDSIYFAAQVNGSALLLGLGTDKQLDSALERLARESLEGEKKGLVLFPRALSRADVRVVLERLRSGFEQHDALQDLQRFVVDERTIFYGPSPKYILADTRLEVQMTTGKTPFLIVPQSSKQVDWYAHAERFYGAKVKVPLQLSREIRGV